MSSSDQEAAAMDQQDGVPAVSAKKLWRMVRAVYLVLGKGLGKHQPKLAALGVHLHHLLSKRHHHDGLGAARDHPALTYLSALSCRSMDPAAAVVHPYPRGASLSSLSCRSMDPGAAVYQYHSRPREVEFSCSSTPLHKRRRRRAARSRGVSLQQQGAGGQYGALPEYSSAATVTRMFELMDVTEEDDDVDGVLDSATPWAAPAPAPRPVRITDSPFPAREEEEEEEEEAEESAVVDRRADEFITWFHEQLRLQQQQQQHRPAARERGATYWVR